VPKKGLVLIGGKKPQLRKTSKRNWTKAKAATFLQVLAETCNVTRACAAAGVSVTHVYRKKKSDAEFRAGWMRSIATAYQQLELVLLERAFNGHERLVKVGGETRVMRDYSNTLGMALLKLHRDSATDAEFELPQDEIEEVRERLIRKLQRMRERDTGGEAQP